MLNAFWRSIRRDEAGGAMAATIIFATCVTMLLGLVVDLGRAYAEHRRMQAWLDGVAVAVAAQMDGRVDSLERARWVAENGGLIAGAKFADAGADYAISNLRFLSSLPQTGISGLSEAEIAGYVTTDPGEARFALLESEPTSLALSVLNLVSGPPAGGLIDLGVRSVAIPVVGEACESAIIAACLPPEGVEAVDVIAGQMQLVQNLDGVWEPGEYGLIADIEDTSDGYCAQFTGDDRTMCLMAINASQSACPPTIDLTTAGTADVSAAMNTRFDIWHASVSHLMNSQYVSSDRNVITGNLYSCTGPNWDQVSGSMGLPDDPCFHNGTCDIISDPIDHSLLQTYWELNHGGTLPEGLNSRYDVYVYEALHNLLDPAGAEDSTQPSCNPNAEPLLERRVIDVALIDCSALSGTDHQDVVVEGYVSGFLTEPATETESYVITFEDPHQRNTPDEGDIVRQDWTPEGIGNPGNYKDVGGSGENPNGNPCWGGGNRGQSDADRCIYNFSLDAGPEEDDGAGGDNGSFSTVVLTDVSIWGDTGVFIEATRHGGEWVRIDKIEFVRTGDLVVRNNNGNAWGNQNNNDPQTAPENPDAASTRTIQAEAMQRRGFRLATGSQADGGEFVKLPSDPGVGTLGSALDLEEGTYTVTIHVQDESDGISSLTAVFTHVSNVLLWPEEDLRILDERDRLTYDPYRSVGLMRIDVKQSVRAGSRQEWQNVPMIFDTSNVTGGDTDLRSTTFNNVVIISEDGDATDPDDEARGGWLIFHFDPATRIDSVRVIDTEEGGVIRVYEDWQPNPTGEFETAADGSLVPMRSGEVHDPLEAAHFTVPRLGDGMHVRMDIGMDAIKTLAYFLPSSGAVDDIAIRNTLTSPEQDDTLSLEIMELLRLERSLKAVVYD